MEKFLCIAFFYIIFLCNSPVLCDNQQQLILYQDKTGNGTEYFDEQPHLCLLDNSFNYFCQIGTWIFYDGYFYDGNDPEAYCVEYLFFANWTCGTLSEQLQSKVSSIRYAGDKDNFFRESLTIYKWETFQGEKQKLFDTTYDLDGILMEMHRSLIITGAEHWSLILKTGKFVCIKTTGNGVPRFIPDLKEVGIEYDSIEKVVKGCCDCEFSLVV